MATNFEFYKDEILDWIKRGGSDCIADLHEHISGVTYECEGRTCSECGKIFGEFLEQEHIEQPKLTKRERAFCELVGTGWLVRDEDAVTWCLKKPVFEELASGNKVFVYPPGENCFEIPAMLCLFEKMEFWQVDKVEDLLKLEAIEENPTSSNKVSNEVQEDA